jgi:hypothetical protein
MWFLWGCIQKWSPGVRTANGTAFCHSVQLYRYFVSQSSEFCSHNTLCCFLTSNTKDKHIFRYRLTPETFEYTLLYWQGCLDLHVETFKDTVSNTIFMFLNVT